MVLFQALERVIRVSLSYRDNFLVRLPLPFLFLSVFLPHRMAWVGRDPKDHQVPTPLLHVTLDPRIEVSLLFGAAVIAFHKAPAPELAQPVPITVLECSSQDNTVTPFSYN